MTSLQPPSPAKANTNTFVHKLHNMVIDKQYQHLIAWNYTGTSFIVCNIMEFSRDVLPKHFKHNNFSSFVRQLNMYGFHKVNKSPRGHRTLAENQIWEFSHQKFLRGRQDLLDDIKRKAMESDSMRRDGGDLPQHMAVIQASQTELLQQITQLQENFGEVVRELGDTRRKQAAQQQVLKSLLEYIQKTTGGQRKLYYMPAAATYTIWWSLSNSF
ncbi:HSF-type DNA-binding-domain-containing protein [Gamsiella multidivaricata]|uniref:HSF-type DNA-binding-domain-containing protein n=1 Tax=Gamsiella multidivaricata TaxID=101098 RepID=UPI00221F9D20|nr:HSF-type DNA-binding-domain-containing protein [Gamsiella multidivaricata]KAI7816769.1 HSF-type DNA-binding-domain-containing protein [Gamsiella multidivaricata]